VKRRKLKLIIKYLLIEENVITIVSITTTNKIRSTISDGVLEEACLYASSLRCSINSGAPEIHTNPLEQFSGDRIDFELTNSVSDVDSLVICYCSMILVS